MSTVSTAELLDTLLPFNPIDPHVQEAWLLAQAVTDVQRQELRELAKHARAFTASFLEQPAASIFNQDDHVPSAGARLGAWQVDGVLGQGGMGTVLAGHRADGAFDAQVAIKLLRFSLASRTLRERFAREQQVLARLDHPRIARLLDAGHTAEGVPYLVMVRISGQTLSHAAAVAPLGQRLDWFLQLCDAVAYAHRQLLVHRDIKPSNVMVDDSGQVRLLDFGVAKLLDDDPAHAPMADITQTRALPLTPLYASPEQLRGETVGTASDVYSLGALLYWLLTNKPPLGDETQPNADIAAEVLRTQPLSPSRVGQSAAFLGKASAELDLITLKALAKLPQDRYSSVDALAADVRAHLNGYPISVKAPSTAYTLKRWVQRNRLLAGVLAFAAACVAVGAVGVSVFALRAENARVLAQTNLSNAQALAQDVVIRFADALVSHPQGQDIQVTLVRQTLAKIKPLRDANAQDADLMLLESSLLVRLADALGNTGIGKPQDQFDAADLALQGQQLAQAAFAGLQTPAQRLNATLNQGSGALLRATHLRDAKQQPVQAAELLVEAIAVQEHFAESPDFSQLSSVERMQFQTRLALLHMVLGGVYFSPNRPNLSQYASAVKHNDTARALYTAALADKDATLAADATRIAGQPSVGTRIRTQLANVDGFAASYELRQDRLTQSLQARQRGLATLQALLQTDAQDLHVRDALWVELLGATVVAARLGQASKAVDHALQARLVIDSLIASKGPQSKWAQQRFQHDYIEAGAFAVAGDFAQARRLLGAALPKLGDASSMPAGRQQTHAMRAALWQILLTQQPNTWPGSLTQLDAGFAGAATHPSFGRANRLLLAQSLAIQASALPAARQQTANGLTQRAIDTFEAAQRELPLAADHAAWLATLKAGKPLGTKALSWPSWPN